jgi:hypothetical protein
VLVVTDSSESLSIGGPGVAVEVRVPPPDVTWLADVRSEEAAVEDGQRRRGAAVPDHLLFPRPGVPVETRVEQAVIGWHPLMECEETAVEDGQGRPVAKLVPMPTP